VIPLGNVLTGAVSAAIGIHPTLFAMSAVGLVVALGIATVPSVRMLPRGTVASAS